MSSRATRGMCERSWYSLVRINMRVTHAILPYAPTTIGTLTT